MPPTKAIDDRSRPPVRLATATLRVRGQRRPRRSRPRPRPRPRSRSRIPRSRVHTLPRTLATAMIPIGRAVIEIASHRAAPSFLLFSSLSLPTASTDFPRSPRYRSLELPRDAGTSSGPVSVDPPPSFRLHPALHLPSIECGKSETIIAGFLLPTLSTSCATSLKRAEQTKYG